MKVALLTLSLLALAVAENLNVGFLGSLSTPKGRAQLEAARQAVDDVNERFASSLSETQLKLRFEDTFGHGPGAAAALNRLVFQYDIKVVVGPFSSEEVKSIAQMAHDNGITIVSPTSTDITLALDDNIIRLSSPDEAQATALATGMRDDGIDCLYVFKQRSDISSMNIGELIKEYFPVTTSETNGVGQYRGSETYGSNIESRLEDLHQKMNKDKCSNPAVLFAGNRKLLKILDTARVLKLAGAFYVTDGFTNADLSLDTSVARYAAAKRLRGYMYTGAKSVSAREQEVIDILAKRTQSTDPSTLLTYDAVSLIGDSRATFRGINTGNWETILPTVASYHHGITGTLGLDENQDRVNGVFTEFTFTTNAVTGRNEWKSDSQLAMDSSTGRPCVNDDNKDPIAVRFENLNAGKSYCVHSLDYPLMANIPHLATVTLPIDRSHLIHQVSRFEVCDKPCNRRCNFEARTCDPDFCSQFEVRIGDETTDMTSTVVWTETNDDVSSFAYSPSFESSSKTDVHTIVISGGVPEMNDVQTIPKSLDTKKLVYCNDGVCTDGTALPKFEEICENVEESPYEYNYDVRGRY